MVRTIQSGHIKAGTSLRSSLICGNGVTVLALCWRHVSRQIEIANSFAIVLSLFIATEAACAATYKASLLHPIGFNSSAASGISGTSSVGGGQGVATGSKDHALLWSGTAGDRVDLHQYLTGLGPRFITSYAEDIGPNGVVVGYAYDDQFRQYAVKWTLVPEPSTCMLVCCSLIAAAIVRHRERRPC